MNKKTYKPRHEIESAEPRLLFSAGLEGVLAAQSLDQPQDQNTAPIEQRVDGQAPASDSPAATELNSELSTELIFVDSDTPEYQTLLDDLQRVQDGTTRYEVVVLDNSTDGIAQITETLGNYTNLSAVHILSHGTDGSIDLGSSQLDAEALAESAELVRTWSNAFSETGDLLIYGCDLAASEAGTSLVNTLSWLTGTDVAASDDLTGSALLGGDWELEYSTGSIETTVAISNQTQNTWTGVLAVTTDSSSTGSTTGSSLTVSHTTSGTETLMIVGVSMDAQTGASVTGVTYNGSALSLLGTVQDTGSNVRVELWQVVAPADGTHDVVVSFSQSMTEGGIAGVMTFNGVDQTTPLGSFASAQGIGSTASVNVSTAVGDMVFSTMGVDGSTDDALNHGAGQTEYWETFQPGTEGAGSTKVATSTSETMSWTFLSNQWSIGAVAIHASTAVNNAPTFIDGSVGNWNFDEGSGGSVAESAIGISTGTLGSTAGADANDPTWTTGKFGQALHFDGVNDYIEIADAPGIDISGPQFSASLWMKPDSGPNQEDMLFMKGDRQGNINYYLSWKNSNEMTWAFKDSAGWHYQDMPVTMPTTGQWNHIGITFDRPTVSLYVNGTKYVFDDVATGGSMDRDLTANDEVLWIGAGRDAGALVGVNQWSGPFAGSIDELALFDRALTDAEIEAIRTSTPPAVTASAFSIDENSANNTVVGTVVANDQDIGDTLSYAITAGNTGGAFSIDANGQIKVANSAALDFETNPVFNLTIEATDDGTPAKSDTTSVSISLNDINDAPAISAWFNDAWESRKALTISAASVAGDLTDFPVLITLNTDPELAAQALANGDDILFTAADGTTQLAHEIEFFDETTGELRVWVKTDLSGSVDTNVFMYFGNDASGNQENIPGVWDNYVGVYHLGESPTGAPGELIDSSGSGNHATTEGSMDGADSVSTTIGQGLAFDGTDDMIRITDSATLDSINDEATFSLWINFVDSADGDTQIIMSSSNRYSGWDGYEWAQQNDGDHFFYPDAMLPDTNYNLGADPFTNGAWHHLAATMDFATKEVKIYVDGSPMTFTYEGVPGSWTTLTSSDDMLWGGNPDRATRYFLGMMDEIRIADVARSQEWIQTEVNNQSAPGAFFSVGVTEANRDSLTDINEDNFNAAGDTVLSIINSSGADRIMDSDAGALEGIAVTAVVDTNGEWQYDANADGTWVAFGAVSSTNAVLLDTGALVRFVPDADYNGSAGDLDFHAWDQTSGANGNTGVDVSINGGITAFSSESFAASLNVDPVNDDPVITSDGGGATANINIAENTIAVTTVIATDVDLDTPVYSINGGADAARFTINPGTGALSFISVPDFENPADIGADNVYNVTVQVIDGNGGTDAQTITVNVIDMADGIRVTPIDVVPIGGETLVNTNTTDNQQIGANVHQGMATDASGNYIVVWGSNLQDGAGWGIYAQRYSADGTALGGEFLISTTTTDHQLNPAVAMDAAGNFVVTWQSNLQDGGSYGVYAQRYNAAGVAQGSEFLVNSTTADYQGSPTIAMDADGDFVIAWVSNGQDPDASLGIYAQRFNASGVAQGGEFRVNTFTTGTQQITSIGMDAAGNFVITWASLNQDGSNYGIFGQRYDATGSALGAEFQVNTTTANSQLYHDVVMLDDGRFVVEYQSRNADGSFEVFLQRYAADGSTVGGEIRVNTTTVSSAQQPIGSITADESGNITVVWNSDADGDGTAVVGQRLDWAGNKLGGEFVVNTTTTGNQLYPEVIAQSGGGFIVAWSGNGAGDVDGVFTQRYGLVVSEEGGSATFQIVLESAPTGDVTIPISVSDPTEGMVSVGSVTFTNGDWNIPQTVTINGVQDFTIDGDQVFQVILGAATSADANFNGLDLADLTIINTELPNQAPTGVPTITGTVVEDQILTADTSSISDPDGLGAFSYQWLRDGVAIAGATGSTHTLGDADVGTQISVEVSYTDVRGTSEGPLVSAQTVVVVNINDAPILDIVGTPALTQIDEGDINNTGDSVASIIASAGGDPITDADASAVEGMAITWADNSNGTWEFSTDGGTNWFAIGTVSDSAALLLTDDANNRIRFVPATNFNGSAQFSYRAWDQTDSNANATAGVDVSTNGTTTAYSTATETADITIRPLQVIMYLSTSGDVSVSGAPGLDSWNSGEVLAFGDPSTNFEPGTTDGTLYSFLDLRNFNTGAIDPAIDGIHQVSKNTTIGGNGGPSMDLFVGDVLFAINSNSVRLTGSDLVELTTNKKSLFMFRPDTPGDYSAGTFSVVLDNFSTNEVEGISLVEVDTMVGDTLLQAGTFLYNPGNSRDIFHYTADGVGAGTTGGVTSTLIAGNDINMTSNSAKVSGIDLVESDVNLGDTSLAAGNILVTLDGNDAGVGNNNLSVTSNDVFYLDVTTTTMGVTNTTTADAYLLIEGADLNLDTADEEITALSLEVKFGSGNEDPDISFPGSSINYTENDPAVLIDNGATVNDPDSFDFAGGILRVDFESGGTVDDRLAIRNEGSGAGQVGVVASTVTYGGVTIGTFTGGTGTNPLVINFNSNSTPAVVQAVLRNITYENVSDDPATASRTVRVVLSDGDGGTSNVERKTVNMTAVNDAPAIAANTGTTVAEGSTGTVITTAMLNEGDPDDSGAGVTYTVTTIPVNGTLYLSGVALGTSGTFTQADIDGGLINYDHDGTQNLSDSFVFSMADGGEDGAAALTGQVFSFTVTNVNDAPVGVPTITGTVTEDQILTADTTGISDEDGMGAFSYQWYRDGVAIGGATASTYTLGDTDVGTTITVVASYTDSYGANESVTSAGTAPVTNVNDTPVGVPTITGTVTEDQILTADTSGISDADGLGAFSYQWLRDGVAIGGATASTYTLGDADVGTQISVQVSYADAHGTSEGPLTSAQTGAVVNVNDAPTGSVTISGMPTEDQILTASNTLADADGLGAVSYQWYRDGVAIGGATASTYTLGDADVGTTITVTASYIDGQGTNESVTSAGVGPIANINDLPVGIPTITGTVTEDQILTADTSGISDADGLGAFSYQWLRDGVAIGGATASTYTLGDADVGALISVQVSYTDLQGTNESVTSAQTAAVANINDAPTGSVTISGILTEDQILTASNTLADADGMGAVSYQWYRDGVAIGGATGATYTLGDADVGAAITVSASYLDGQGTNESVTSAGVGPIANVNDLPVGTPTITGTVTEDQILTADTAGISDADGLGAFSYQWYRDGVAIGGATASTYTLDDADVNALISVQVSYTDGQGTAESITSAQTGAVANVNDLPVGLPTISGTATEDQILTADTSGISDADGLGAFSYQWYRDGVAIGGATVSTYTLGDADVGTQISVQVGYTDLQGTVEGPLASAQTGAVANINDAPTGSVTISGTPTEDQVLTASNTLADADGLGAISYQWYRDGVAIGGANGSTYTLGDADVGSNITVEASYTDGQGTNESVTSTGVGPIANINDAPVGLPTITGTVTEDQMLTADTSGISDADGLGVFSYQWLRDGIAIGGATASTYTLGDADVGTQISVQVIYTDLNGTAESVTSAQTAAVANINDAPTGNVTIDNMTPTEGDTLTASNTLADADGLSGAIGYQWYRDGVAIGGATGTSYTTVQADVGAVITVVAGYTDDQGTAESMTSAGTAAVLNLNNAPTGSVTISGTPTEDQILTASNTLADVDGMGAISYQWYRDGVAIGGATASTYTLGDADVSATITVTASYTDGQGTAESVSSAGVGPIANVNDLPVGVPTITGTVTEDQILTADTSGISDADGLGAFSYQWLRDGVAIGGATASTYTLDDADVNALISVQVSYTDGQGTAEGPLASAQTGAVANINDAPTGSVTISGTPTEDQILTASNTLADADGMGAVSYQWYRDGVAIGGATASTYTLGDADVGAAITVSASYTDGQGTNESVTSTGVGPIANINDAPVGLPTITGTVTEDQLLTVDTSGISDADGLGVFSYQWLRDGIAIGGATASTYTLGDADVGATITVTASYTDGQGTAESVTSTGVGPIANINDLPVGVPTITGTVTEDQILTADTSGISDADGLGVFSYQWLRDGIAIGGATASTYTLGDTDVGTQISVQVIYTDLNGTVESVTSAQTAAVLNINDAPTGSVTIDNMTPAEGDTLTAANTLADADGLSGAIGYQWYRDGVSIGGATGTSYTTVQADVGTVITVVASYTDDQGTNESVSSAGTAAVTNVNNAPTGSVTISGTPTEDQVLTASNTLADADGMGAVSYQWYRDGVAIGGATGTTYTIGDADVGAAITVSASYLDGQGTNESVTSAGVGPIANVNDLPVGLPTITGTVTEDQILTADTSGISDADGLGAFSYQWLRDGVAIGGATSSTYTLGDADVGALISVQVSYTDLQGTSEGPLTSAQTAAVANINDAPTGSVNISGILTEDQILTVSNTLADADGMGAVSYQWYRDGVAIGGATGSTYTLGDADVGAAITVSASYLDGQGTNESVTSAGVGPIANVNDLPVGTPTITGTVTEDQILTADTAGISDADGLGAFSYQWYRDGAAIGGATASTYTLDDADVNALISVEVSYTDGQGTAESITSAQTGAVANVNDLPVGLPTISGTATEDQILTADTSGISDADGLGVFNYQWYRDGVAIGGSTASTYTLGDADVGTQISVQVSYTDLQGTAEGPLASAQTGLVGNINDAPTGSVTISGTPTEDQVLTASNTLADADGLGAIGYQWYRDGVAIGGATGSTYTLGDADVGAAITVTASYTDGQGTNESVTSAGVGPIANVNDLPVGAPTITGTVTEDQILTADTAGISDADGLGAFSYQWYRDGVAIGGATASTYTLDDVDVNAQISVEVSYTDLQGTSESVTSAQTAAVANINDAPTGNVTIDNMTPAEGDTLTAANTLADADGLSGAIGYQWYRDGVAIGGATGTSYTTVQADVGAIITVVASYTDDQGTNESVTSAGTAAITNVNNAPTGSVTISGTPTEDQVLTASNTLADADGMGAVSYQWYRDGVAIGGATASTYTLGDADVSATITVTASYTDGQGTAESVSSAGVGPIANVNDLPVGVPTITGTVTEDQILTADTSGISDADGLGAFSYQWYRDGAAIGGATASTYTLDDADVNALISVEVSYTDGQGTAESITSAQTGAVANVNDLPVGLPTISGTATEDQILTADTSGISDADGLGAFSYQWYRDGVAIGGATVSTYTLGDADVGTQISVQVGYTDLQGTVEGPLASAQTGAVANINDAPTGSVTISGTPTEDQVLTASNTLADADGLGAISYQWYRDGVAIGGATGSTYTLGDADVSATITVEASYTDGYGTNESVTSAGAGPIANINDAPTITNGFVVGLPGTDEDSASAGTTASAIVNSAGWNDADAGAAQGLAITGMTGNGTWQYSTDAVTWVSFGAVSPTNALLLNSTTQIRYVGDSQNGEVATFDFRAWDLTAGTASTNATPGYADPGAGGGGSAYSSESASANVTVTDVNDAPTGSVTISGTPTEDQVLTASNTLADVDGMGAISYQWYRDGVVIGGATASTYTLGDADVGATITVTAGYTDGGGTNESVSSAGVGPIANINDAPTGNVTIDNMTPAEGDTLTASNTLADADGLSGAIGYQWYRDGVAIGGATSNTYTTMQADVGAVITVVASYTDDQGTNESVSSAGTAAVINVNNAPTGSVTISGTPTEDQILTASNTLADADGMGAISYQWYRDGVAIGGATGVTYTLGDTDVGTTITVEASYTDGYGTNESMTSAGVGPIANVNDAPTGAVTISGTPTEDQVLTASNTLADADGLGAISYQWFRDGVAIGGATGTTYTLGDADVGTTITVEASYTDGYGTSESVTSAGVGPIGNINDAPVGVPTITGTATEDQMLTADTSGISDADGLGAFSYQWYRDGVAIGGATGSTYTLGDADVGTTITVEASYTDGYGTSESVTSAGAGPIANINDAPTGAVTISGTSTEDQVLTASNTLADADGLGAIAYQWFRDGVAIGGATGSTYTLGDADVGTTITVEASYTDGYGTSESVTSAGAGPIANINDAPTGAVTISGTPTEDQVLTASNTLADADGLGAIAYQWFRDGVAIGGATGTTYTLGDADVGTTITVEASYTDGYGTSESVTSAGVGPIANVNDAMVGVPAITGTVAEDQLLTADTSGISDADGLGAFSYQWYRDGSAISGATGSTYTTGDADVDAQISVQTSYTDQHGTAESATSAQTAAVANINDAPTGSVLIDNMSPAQGDTLTASNTLADADGLSGPITYQWFRDGSAIAGATGATYTTVQVDVGAALTVVASYTDDQGTAESISSSPTSTINATTSTDDTVIVPADDPTDGNEDPTPVKQIDVDDGGNVITAGLVAHHNSGLTEDNTKIQYTVDDYEFSNFDYREDDSKRFGLSAPFKNLMHKAVDVAVDLTQLIDLIRIQINEPGEKPGGMFIRVIGGITLSLSAGMATLLTRSSAIAAGLMSSVSVMKGFDPLIMMKNSRRGKAGSDEDDNEMDEAVDNLFENAGETKQMKDRA